LDSVINGGTIPGCHYRVPFVPILFRVLLMEKCATCGNVQESILSIKKISKSKIPLIHVTKIEDKIIEL
jgi:hypothetical protein